MSRLHELFKRFGIEFYELNRMSLDNYFYEPFQDKDQVFEEDRIFETDNLRTTRTLTPYSPSLFEFFLDGSRKPYKIGDIITPDNKFVPLVVGQIGTACCKRNQDKKIQSYEVRRKNVLMIYDSIPEGDFRGIEEHIKKNLFKGAHLEVGRYAVKNDIRDNPTNAAVAKIQKMMQDMEVELLTDMVKQRGVLSTHSMLVIDGSLQFLTQKFDPQIFYNVIGVSKSFNPNLVGILKKKKHIATRLAHLRYGERTPVYKYQTQSGYIKNSIGAWYLRIHEPQKVRSPLEGIVKIEKMAMTEDDDAGGFDSGLIDNISRCILAERNPTCFGKDERWANHLYPIYLTEKLLKQSFLSDIHFMNLF